MNRLPTAQNDALTRVRRHFGRRWKDKLRQCWMHASYPPELRDMAPHLQHIRNTLGPSGLSRLK